MKCKRTGPGAPVCDRLKAELGSTRLAVFIHRAGGRDAQSRLQAGAPPDLLAGAVSGGAQAHLLGPFARLKIATHGISYHRIQFGERITLGGDAAAFRRIPARHVASGFRARFHPEYDFSDQTQVGTLSLMLNVVNPPKF